MPRNEADRYERSRFNPAHGMNIMIENTFFLRRCIFHPFHRFLEQLFSVCHVFLCLIFMFYLFLFIAVLSTSYPSFKLSRFQPADDNGLIERRNEA